jgi:hypothetical protein
MHQLIVAFAFVTMVACPAIVALFPQSEAEENSDPVAECHTDAPCHHNQG